MCKQSLAGIGGGNVASCSVVRGLTSSLSEQMVNERTTLLNNALDALDRLFDRETEVVDLYAILYATGLAMRSDDLSSLFRDAASSLKELDRAGFAAEQARESALSLTNSLRLAVAEALE